MRATRIGIESVFQISLASRRQWDCRLSRVGCKRIGLNGFTASGLRKRIEPHSHIHTYRRSWMTYVSCHKFVHGGLVVMMAHSWCRYGCIHLVSCCLKHLMCKSRIGPIAINGILSYWNEDRHWLERHTHISLYIGTGIRDFEQLSSRFGIYERLRHQIDVRACLNAWCITLITI